eukprot:CAMPEP_0185840520 /NCGR_PEP_ID=MMETSP1353-20130828/16365_1 /TAXON_ID=1077150 /ORGANISM="Erythrolobus australicus, Strain CCMP3124" /LENGTH=586 /DNA_ID=CAMNT_0028539859 /DNA_START=514 /DNA_END=2274 /DNA_ORIENTATION=-
MSSGRRAAQDVASLLMLVALMAALQVRLALPWPPRFEHHAESRGKSVRADAEVRLGDEGVMQVSAMDSISQTASTVTPEQDRGAAEMLRDTAHGSTHASVLEASAQSSTLGEIPDAIRIHQTLQISNHSAEARPICRISRVCVTSAQMLALIRRDSGSSRNSSIFRVDELRACIPHHKFTAIESKTVDQIAAMQCRDYRTLDIVLIPNEALHSYPPHHIPHFFDHFEPALKTLDSALGSRSARDMQIDPAILITNSAIADYYLHKPSTWVGHLLRMVQSLGVKILTPYSNLSTMTLSVHTPIEQTSESQGSTNLLQKQRNVRKLRAGAWCGCFRSALTLISSHSTLRSSGLSAEHPMLLNNGIDIRPRQRVSSSCAINVTLLDRRDDRRLSDSGAVLDAIRSQARLNSHFSLTIKLAYFENASVTEQIAVMQQTEILIAVHGAGEANIVWMHRGSTVLEFALFAYGTTFEQLARRYGHEFVAISAAPQAESFRRCMRWRDLTSNTGTSDTVMSSEQMWYENAVRRFYQGEHQSGLGAIGGTNSSRRVVARMMRCARVNAPIVVDSGRVADEVLKQATRICETERIG